MLSDAPSTTVARLVRSGASGVVPVAFVKAIAAASILLLTVGIVIGSMVSEPEARTSGADALVQFQTESPAPPGPGPERDKSEPAKVEMVRIEGKVVDENGRPIGEAKIYYSSPDPPSVYREIPLSDPLPSIAMSDDSGVFAIEVSKSDLDDRKSTFEKQIVKNALDLNQPQLSPIVAAYRDGFGIGWTELDAHATEKAFEVKLQTDSIAVSGKIYNLEGKPIAGVKVKVLEIRTSPTNSLEPLFEAEARNRKLAAEDPKLVEYKRRQSPHHALERWIDCRLLKPIKPGSTDADGRFVIRGIGPNRLARLRIEGPGLATETRLFVMTSQLGALLYPIEPGHKELGNYQYVPVHHTYVASRGQSIQGVVKDAKSGATIAGLRVNTTLFGLPPMERRFEDNNAKTDDQGRFTIEGTDPAPRGITKRLIRANPELGQPYLAVSVNVEGVPGDPFATADVALPKGIRLHGRAIDKSTRQALSGLVRYYVLDAYNKNARLLGSVQLMDWIPIGSDGSFSLIVPSGIGFLEVVALDNVHVSGFIEGDDKSREIVEKHNAAAKAEYGLQPHASLSYICSIDEDSGERSIDLEVPKAAELRCKIIGPDGLPVVGCLAYLSEGIGAASLPMKLESDAFTAKRLAKERPRPVFVRTEDQALGAILCMTGEEPEPVVFKLVPCATLRGRLVGEDGKPLTKVIVGGIEKGQIGLPYFERVTIRGKTDADGRFEIKGVFPDLKTSIFVYGEGVEKNFFVQGRSFKPGENVDLGEVVVKSPGR